MRLRIASRGVRGMKSPTTSTQWYKKVFETLSEAILVLSKDNTIIYGNNSFCKLFDYSKKEIVDQSMEILFVKDESSKNGGPMDEKAKPALFGKKKGANFSGEYVLFAIKDHGPTEAAYVAVIKDLSQNKGIGREKNMKSKGLVEMNEALKTLLARGEEEKKYVEEKIQTNVKELVLPYMERLKDTKLTVEQQTYLEIIETTVKNVFSSFLQKITSRQYRFTPKEIQVATLIREGKTTKEIADVMNVTRSAIGLHRHHIRNKLGLGKAKVNLRSHLLSLQ
jgi:PAS domain S-box-containing protein